MAVFVLDKQGRPLMPCSEKRARLLLDRGRARVHRILPFVIRLVDRKAEASDFQALRLKIDPGSKATGLALVREARTEQAVLNRLSARLLATGEVGQGLSNWRPRGGHRSRGQEGRHTRWSGGYPSDG